MPAIYIPFHVVHEGGVVGVVRDPSDTLAPDGTFRESAGPKNPKPLL